MNNSNEEKINRFLDAQEHPEHYTDEELKEIIDEAQPLAQLKRALTEERAENEDIDVDSAWRAFCQAHDAKQHSQTEPYDDATPQSDCIAQPETDSAAVISHRRSPRWLRLAAVFLGCVLLTGVAFAAMTGLGWLRNPFDTERPEVAQRTSVKASSRDTVAAVDSISPEQKASRPAPEVKVFDNATLADILNEMGRYYGLKVIYHNTSARTIRLHFEWNQAKGIDAALAVLNGFQQITVTHSGNEIVVDSATGALTSTPLTCT